MSGMKCHHGCGREVTSTNPCWHCWYIVRGNPLTDDERAMKEHPILFSGPLVRAILDGKKTITRRLVKNEPKVCAACFEAGVVHNEGDGGAGVFGSAPYLRVNHCEHLDVDGARIRYRAEVGDRLWVRETWAPVDFLARGHELHDPIAVGYRADHSAISHERDNVRSLDVTNWGWSKVKWKPSIFMPRWASRILLEVVSVRVERLQDITEEDARAEGVDESPAHGEWVGDRGRQSHWSFRKSFADLWDSINGERAPWESNPFVWRVEFKRVTP